MKSTIGKINADHLDIPHRIKKLGLLEAKKSLSNNILF